MKRVKRGFTYCFAFLFISLIAVFISTPVFSWFGAGTTSNWDNAFDGLSGSVVNSISSPTSFYTAGDAIAITFQLTNPTDTLIQKPFYLKIFRVIASPLSRNLGDSSAADTTAISENEFYINNKNGNDAQIEYVTFPLGTQTINSQSTAQFTQSFTINDAGYYQFDVTDYGSEQPYQSGHIYVAGFLRIVTPTQNTTKNSDTSTSNSSSGGSSNPPTCSDKAPGSAPALISAVPGYDTVTLTWTEAQDPVSYYLIAYGTSSGKYLYGNPNVGGKGTTSYIIRGVSGASFYFVVRAGNGCAPGAFSRELLAVPQSNIENLQAAGFQNNVLGIKTSTESGLINQPGQTLGNQTRICTNCKWLPVVLFYVMGTLGYVMLIFLRKKSFSSSKKMLLLGYIIPVLSIVFFVLINRPCISNPFFMASASIICKYFAITSLGVTTGIHLVTHRLFLRKLKRL